MISCYTTPPAGFDSQVEVAAIYVEVNGSYLFLKIGNHKPEGGKWGVPAGKLEPDESASAAAVRELYEETGIQTKEEALISLGTLYFQKPDCAYIYHMYRLSLTKPCQVQLSNEHTHYAWMTPETLKTQPFMLGAIEALEAALKQGL